MGLSSLINVVPSCVASVTGTLIWTHVHATAIGNAFSALTADTSNPSSSVCIKTLVVTKHSHLCVVCQLIGLLPGNKDYVIIIDSRDSGSGDRGRMLHPSSNTTNKVAVVPNIFETCRT